MKYHFLIFILFICFLNENIFSQTEFYPAKTFDIKLFGGRTTSTSYYDIEGKNKFELPDHSIDEDQEAKDYIFEYERYNFGIKSDYSITNDLVIFAEIPLNYHSILEQRDTTEYYQLSGDTTLYSYEHKIKKADMSLFQPAYYSIGARYRLYSKLAYFALLGELRIPPGFHKGINNDPDYDFLSDGAFEFHSGIILGAKLEKGWLESQILYRHRTEELVDELFIHTEAGLATVPGTGLMIFLDFIQSMGTYKNAREFIPHETTLQENLINAGAKFKIFLTETFYVDFSYSIILTGKNTMNKSGYNFGAGIIIDN
jgi:hypothetical protein